MKYLITINFMLCMLLLFSTTSCIVTYHTDNVQHKGWNKNPNNPHHPNTTNPGKSKGKGKSGK